MKKRCSRYREGYKLSSSPAGQLYVCERFVSAAEVSVSAAGFLFYLEAVFKSNKKILAVGIALAGLLIAAGYLKLVFPLEKSVGQSAQATILKTIPASPDNNVRQEQNTPNRNLSAPVGYFSDKNPYSVELSRRGLYASAHDVKNALNRKNGSWVFKGILNPGDKLKSVKIRYMEIGRGNTMVPCEKSFLVSDGKITGPIEMDTNLEEKALFVFDVQYAGCDLILKEANADFTSGSKPQFVSLTIAGNAGKDIVIPMIFVEKYSVWPDNKTDGSADLRGIQFKTTGEIILDCNPTDLDAVAKLYHHFSASVVNVNGLKFKFVSTFRKNEKNIYTYLYTDPNAKAAIKAKTELEDLLKKLEAKYKAVVAEAKVKAYKNVPKNAGEEARENAKKDMQKEISDDPFIKILRELYGKDAENASANKLCMELPLNKLKERLVAREFKKDRDIQRILVHKRLKGAESLDTLIKAQDAVITKRHKAIEAKLARQTPAEMRLENGKVLKRITAQPCQW